MSILTQTTNGINHSDLLTQAKCQKLIALIKETKYYGWKQDAHDMAYIGDQAKRFGAQPIKPMSTPFKVINRIRAAAFRGDVDEIMNDESN